PPDGLLTLTRNQSADAVFTQALEQFGQVVVRLDGVAAHTVDDLSGFELKFQDIRLHAEQCQFRLASGGVLPVGERAGLDDVTAGCANRRRGRLRFGRGGFLAVIVVTGAAGAAAVAVAAVRRV